jgi:hypothetical protein
VYYDHIALVTTNPDPEFHRVRCVHIARAIGVQPDDITVHQFVNHPEGPDKGCFSSHQFLWRFAHENGFDRTLICEDDVVFLKPVRPVDFDSFLQRQPDWDIFYFGHRPMIWDERLLCNTDTPGIVQVRTNDTHAYVLSASGAAKMARVPWYGKAIDISLRENTGTAFALFPMRAIQCGRFGSPSFFNGMSERNSQYIRYALQRPLHVGRAVVGLLFVVLIQPWIFLSSTWYSFLYRYR